MYELGLFTGAAKDHPLKRVIFFRVGDTKVASDLKGLGYVSVDPTNPTRPKIRKEVFQFADRLKAYKAPYSSHPFKVTGKRELFKAGAS